jgi:AraC-like DNA-binding protein
VIGFDRARRALGRPRSLAGVAADTGFFDQAHLAREFRALAGCSPTAWLAEEFGFVQAAAAVRDDDGWYDS